MKRLTMTTGTARIVTALGAMMAWAAIGAVAQAQVAGPVYPTSAMYDENTVVANAVDAIAAGTNQGTTGLISGGANALSDFFATDFQTAWTQNTGGVIGFDLVVAASELTNRFFATYGASNQFLFTVTRSDTSGPGGLNTNNNGNVISGSATTSNYLGNSGDPSWDMTFNPPLVEFGITAVSRGADRQGVMTINFTDGSTPYSFGVENLGATADDTFFGYKATGGKLISSVSWLTYNPATNLPDPTNTGLFVRWDDLAFSTSNLAPCDVDGLNGCTTADADLIRQNLLVTGASRGQGDLTGDGIVNLLDFKLWKTLSGGGIGSGAGAVPEPSTLLLVLLGAAAGLGRHRS